MLPAPRSQVMPAASSAVFHNHLSVSFSPACELSNCRQCGVLSCDEGSAATCNACTMTNCHSSGARAEAYGSITLDKCNLVRNQGSGCSAVDGGIVTATEGCINSNASHGLVLQAAAANLTNLHVDFNARSGVRCEQQSTTHLARAIQPLFRC
jgi:hypothetical protein